MMNISEVAIKTNISPDTLRYYERIGLIPPVPRKANGIRVYDESFVQWINLVQKLKAMGMSLEMIMDYFSLAKLGDTTSCQRRELIEEIRRALLAKIMNLQEMVNQASYQLENYDKVLLPKTNRVIHQWR